jgi:hypothetical protein
LIEEDGALGDAQNADEAGRRHGAVGVEDALELAVEVLDGEGAELVEDASNLDAVVGVWVRATTSCDQEASPARAEAQALDEELRKGIEDREIPPAQIADHVVAAIRADTSYILTYPVTKEEVRVRVEGILEGRNPEA